MNPVKGKRNITGQFVGMGEVVGNEKIFGELRLRYQWADGQMVRLNVSHNRD